MSVARELCMFGGIGISATNETEGLIEIAQRALLRHVGEGKAGKRFEHKSNFPRLSFLPPCPCRLRSCACRTDPPTADRALFRSLFCPRARQNAALRVALHHRPLPRMGLLSFLVPLFASR